jgi:DNA-binding beta-propeller fold protein YncE
MLRNSRLRRDTAPAGWLLLAAIVCLPAFFNPSLVSALQISGLQSPQSFLADPSGEQYFISNANGDPDAKDNNGFITKLDNTGKVIQLQFIQGGAGGTTLHAPKGMAIADRVLYMTDLDTLRGFDKTTGQLLITVTFEKYRQNGTSVALSDVVYDGQSWLYVSDTEANTIYRVNLTQQHAVSIFAKDPILAGPRGLALHPKTGRLIVTSWHKGKILEVTTDGVISELVSNSFFSSRFHNLDGVDFDNLGNMYVSDFTAGKVWRMRPDRRFDVIAEYLPSPADIGVDRKQHLILVPYEYGNAAEMNGLESPVKSKGQKRTLADYGFTGGPKDGQKEPERK